MLADTENVVCALHVLATRNGYVYPPPLKDPSSGNLYVLNMTTYVAFAPRPQGVAAHLQRVLDSHQTEPFAVLSQDNSGFWTAALHGEGRAFTLGPIASEREAIEETCQAMQDEFGVVTAKSAPWS